MPEEHSVDFLLGKILEQVNSLKEDQARYEKYYQDILEKFTALQCPQQSQRIDNLEKWKQVVDDTAAFRQQSGLKLKHAIIVAMVSSGFSWFLLQTATRFATGWGR